MSKFLKQNVYSSKTIMDAFEMPWEKVLDRLILLFYKYSPFPEKKKISFEFSHNLIQLYPKF